MKSELHYFSPTKGGEKIAKAIARGLEGDDKSDITPAVFVTPVYSGHMPGAAKERFKNIKAKGNQPAILVAVYGNRAFEQALTDLETFIKERGYTPVSAAAFVCEHSYSTPETPIAAGRPDISDLQEAEQLGYAVKTKLLMGDLSPRRTGKELYGSSGCRKNGSREPRQETRTTIPWKKVHEV